MKPRRELIGLCCRSTRGCTKLFLLTGNVEAVVADLTGRPPRTFAEFAHDHAGVFQGPAGHV